MEGGENQNPLQVVLPLPAFVPGNRTRRRNQRATSGSSGQGPQTTDVTKKRPRGRPAGSKNKVRIKDSGKSLACAAEASDKLVCIETGQDIFPKILSFAEKWRGPIFVHAAIGFVSSATILPLCSSAGVKAYEGVFKILSLTGLVEPTEAGSHQASPSEVSGGLYLQFFKPDDGIIISGTLAGKLIASSTVKLVLKGLTPMKLQEQKPKKESLGFVGAFESTGSASEEAPPS